jgi:dephospho-CoA kinase
MAIRQEDVDYLKGCKVVVIIGLPASGKTSVALQLHEDVLHEHTLYQTDDYIDFGYEQSLYAMLKEMEYDKNPRKIVEGVQGFRFLRKNAETQAYKVDAVVIVDCKPEERAKRYAARGKGNLPSSFDRNLETVFKGYLDKMHAAGHPLPRFINVNT